MIYFYLNWTNSINRGMKSEICVVFNFIQQCSNVPFLRGISSAKNINWNRSKINIKVIHFRDNLESITLWLNVSIFQEKDPFIRSTSILLWRRFTNFYITVLTRPCVGCCTHLNFGLFFHRLHLLKSIKYIATVILFACLNYFSLQLSIEVLTLTFFSIDYY